MYPPASNSWWMSPRFLRAAPRALVAIWAVQSIWGILIRDNDFLYHWGLGQALARTRMPLEDAFYPVGRAAFDALLTLLPYRAARALIYLLAGAAIHDTARLWLGWIGRGTESGSRRALAALCLAAALLMPYVLRDLDECGLQFLMLWMLTRALDAAMLRQPIRCGFWLAAAVTWKAAPLLALVYLLLKRQFKPVLAAAALIVIFNLAMPALHMGWPLSIKANLAWVDRARQMAEVSDPLLTPGFTPKHQNFSLQTSIGRYLRTVDSADPPWQLYFLKSRGFIQFLDLPPAAARGIATLIILAILAISGWRMRHPLPVAPDAGLLGEWAALFILIAILSPFTWRQHLILLLPAAMIWIDRLLGAGRLSAGHRMLLGVIVLAVWLLQRGFWPREYAVVIMSYKLDAFTALALMFTVLFGSNPGLKPLNHGQSPQSTAPI